MSTSKRLSMPLACHAKDRHHGVWNPTKEEAVARTLAELLDERPVDRAAVESIKTSMVQEMETFRRELESPAGDSATKHDLAGKSRIVDSDC